VQAEVERIRAAAVAAGKPAMLIALDAADGRALYAQGFQAVMVSALNLTAVAARNFLKDLGCS
jgi:2-keto-3-deoxy-L-rhamnonate aldolase RhmA